ncbi:hypothetical protein Nepgr_020709 [Nepenthes gracilis]|uniref:Uncharacterized protein n=1 Tax=Nepenthes gracilis TaxID=150966 RepID=A0AAD3XVG6_NEPGR|nr:hypothetical protein Nepgr_020709 [Nepenthes gracilis]
MVKGFQPDTLEQCRAINRPDSNSDLRLRWDSGRDKSKSLFKTKCCSMGCNWIPFSSSLVMRS